MANTRLVYPCVVHDAFGSCTYDYDGKTMTTEAVHYAGFTMGFVGLIMVIIGVFVKGDTRQTLWGLYWWFAFLDRLGGVSLPILRSPLWCTTRD